MTPIGDSLRRAREEKGIELERVAEDTKIAKRFLVALEAEDFSVFPGEPYAVGFLRNYAEYLSLDGNELAAAFRALRIQEQPMPIQELLPATKRPIALFAGIGAAVIIVLIVALALMGRGKRQGVEEISAAQRGPMEYRMESASLDRRLYKGDSVLTRAGNDTWKITLVSLDDGVNLETPLGPRHISLGEETLIDFNKDGQPDIRILLSDLDKKNASRGAGMRFTLLGASLAQAGSAAAIGDLGSLSGPAAAPLPAAPASVALPSVLPPPVGQAENSGASQATREGAIFEAQKSSYPFVVSVTFRGGCMFRYEVDKRDRDERYYQKGDTISVNANNSVKLWASNAQSAIVVVQASGGKTANVDLGVSGEIAVKRIAWVQNENNSYTLSLFEVD